MPLFEGGFACAGGALHDHRALELGAGDGVVEKAALPFVGFGNRVGPDHDDDVELTILGLVHGESTFAAIGPVCPRARDRNDPARLADELLEVDADATSHVALP